VVRWTLVYRGGHLSVSESVTHVFYVMHGPADTGSEETNYDARKLDLVSSSSGAGEQQAPTVPQWLLRTEDA